MGCGASVPELELDTIKPETASLTALRKKVKKLRKEVAKGGEVPTEVLERFGTLMTIKEELHAEPKPGKKGYFDVAIPLADIRKESGRLQSLEGKAKEANILTEAEQQALQARRGLLDHGFERGRPSRAH